MQARLIALTDGWLGRETEMCELRQVIERDGSRELWDVSLASDPDAHSYRYFSRLEVEKAILSATRGNS